MSCILGVGCFCLSPGFSCWEGLLSLRRNGAGIAQGAGRGGMTQHTYPGSCPLVTLPNSFPRLLSLGMKIWGGGGRKGTLKKKKKVALPPNNSALWLPEASLPDRCMSSCCQLWLCWLGCPSGEGGGPSPSLLQGNPPHPWPFPPRSSDNASPITTFHTSLEGISVLV